MFPPWWLLDSHQCAGLAAVYLDLASSEAYFQQWIFCSLWKELPGPIQGMLAFQEVLMSLMEAQPGSPSTVPALLTAVDGRARLARHP